MMYHKKIPSINFLVDSMEPSELIFRILMDSMEYKDLTTNIFWERLSKAPMPHACANMHISEAYGFQEPVIATNIKTAYKLIRFPSPKPKFFFLNDLEWLRFPQKDYEVFSNIYRHPELTILARCDDHKILIENCWNIKVGKVVDSYKFYEPDFIEFFNEKIKASNKRVPPTIEYKPIYEYI